jgi:histidine ammonia-lyase
VVPNGNFATPDVVLGLESVRLALAHVGRLSARRTAVLSALARPLRAAGRAGIPGLLAYTGAERLNDLQRLAAPVSLDAVVLSEVEDYATWGWTAARTAHDAVDATADLLAIEALHAASLLRDSPVVSGVGTAPLRAALVRLLERGGTAEELVRGATELLAGDAPTD